MFIIFKLEEWKDGRIPALPSVLLHVLARQEKRISLTFRNLLIFFQGNAYGTFFHHSS